MTLRRGRGGNWWSSVIVTLLLLVVGTMLGRAFPLEPLSLHVGFAPVALNLYVVALTVTLATNVLGLLGAVFGLVLTRLI